jgi:hypothetical protein
MTSAKIVGHRETSRFVRSNTALTREVTRLGSVRTHGMALSAES